MSAERDARAPDVPRIGTRVEVRCTFDGVWARGFEVAGTTPDGYRVRRLSDDYVLPSEFGSREVRSIA